MAASRELSRQIYNSVRELCPNCPSPITGYLEMNVKKRSPLGNLKFLIGLGFLSLLLVVGVPAITHRAVAVAPVAQQVLAAEQLLALGKQHYRAGRYSQAATVWQQASVAYRDRGLLLNQAVSLNYLSNAYQELGRWDEAQEAIASSLNLLDSQKSLDDRAIAILAQAFNTQGSIQLATGQTETALETWKQAETAYERAGNQTGKLGSQINQAQALQTLGMYRRAKTMLERVNDQLQTQPDSVLKTNGLRSLGRALQVVGDLSRSKEILEQSWAISQRIGATSETSATLFSIGNIARDLQQDDVALAYYREAAKIADNPILQVQAQLNQLSLSIETQQWSEVQKLVSQIQSNLEALPASRDSIYARVNLAASMMKMARLPEKSVIDFQETARFLAPAVQQAQQLADGKAEAFALNQLGQLYEQTEQWRDAQNLTERALEIAQQINAAEIGARASWQLGRILKIEGDREGAIAAYTNAFSTLKSLQSDLVAINPDIQFDFRDSVEPVYRQLVSLLLQPANISGGDVPQENLIQARLVIESLQEAEIENFFREACLETQPVQIDEIDSHAAVIYPIILSDRLEVILSLPDRSLRHYATPLPRQRVEEILQQLYSSFYLGYSGRDRLRLSQQVYDWLVRPAEAELADQGIKTLVFVPDGYLRNIPMAALYDGQHYLVENYSIALSQGLQLFPEALSRSKLKTLAVGLTEARQGFSALPGVEKEVKQITSQVESKVLLDREFTSKAFQQQINIAPFPVVHLATHGQFSSNPEETFLLTWDGRINVKEFDRLLNTRQQRNRTPIELLVLSACQTAAGDAKAALGLAGFALRSGARSTLATLWSVSDLSTADLISEFYQQLAQPTDLTITKAEALRQAQLALLQNPQYDHPYFWAPFVLVGNWL